MKVSKKFVKKFWEDKIIGWESNRYGNSRASSGPLETIAGRSSSSLLYRKQLAFSLMKDHLKGMRVVELGCGSGTMAENIIATGAANYVGIDIASNVIKAASDRIQKSNMSDVINFRVGSVSELTNLSGDIVFSLGLFDWLNEEEIYHIIKNTAKWKYLHSISEHRPTLSQLIHKLYVYISYGHKNNAYVPQYQNIKDLEKLIIKGNGLSFNTVRHRRLNFGAILTSFPTDGG